MRQAIGFLIVLWGLSQYFNQSIASLDDAGSQSFKTLQTAAQVAEQRLIEK